FPLPPLIPSFLTPFLTHRGRHNVASSSLRLSHRDSYRTRMRRQKEGSSCDRSCWSSARWWCPSCWSPRPCEWREQDSLGRDVTDGSNWRGDWSLRRDEHEEKTSS
ncbi:hypothetical protein PENTCL1PPCAC_26965, partial [Pristionchus entomophagus]